MEIYHTILVECYFSNNKLQLLYTTGKSKKYKLKPDIVERFIWLVVVIEAAKDMHDFWGKPALNFEKMKGSKTRHSFRINIQYRLEVDIEWENDEQTVGIVGIDDISNHYQ